MSSPADPLPILVIPGLDGHPGLLAGVADRLFPGLRPVFYDHQLDRAEGGAAGMAERALALVPGDGPLLVCGESFGGTVALEVAHRCPERVRGLVLLSAFGWYPLGTAGQVGLRFWDRLGDRAAERVVRAARPLGLATQLGLRPTREAVRSYLGHPLPDLAAYRAKCAISCTFDARPWLADIRCPALVLTGTVDTVVPVRCGRDLAARLPHARLHRLPGGHIPHITHSAEAGRLVAAWVTENVERGTPSTNGEA